MKKHFLNHAVLSFLYLFFLVGCGHSEQATSTGRIEDYETEDVVIVGSSPHTNSDIDFDIAKKKYLYSLSLLAKGFDSISDKIKVKGSNTYKLNVEVWAKIASENDTEGQTLDKNYAEDRQFVYNDYKKIKVVLTSNDGSIKFSKGDKLLDSIVITKSIPDAIGKDNTRIISSKESFVIHENFKNVNKETGIKAEVFLEKSSEVLQSQTLELVIVPLTFGEKLQNFYLDAQTETINKMSVLYTALLGIIVSAIIAFVRRKLKVKEDSKEA